MKEWHIGSGRVQQPAGAEQTDPKLSPEVEWIMKIGKGLLAVGKGISNVMDTASSAVESAGNFQNDCACEVSSWDWGWFDFLLNRARGYSGGDGGFSPYKLFGAAAKGTHNFVFGTAKGLLNMIGHPVETAKGIGHAVTHPKELLNGLKEQYWGSRKNWVQKVSGVTEAACDIAFLLYGAKKGFDKLSKGSKAGETGEVAEEAAKTGEAGDVAKAGEVADDAGGKVKVKSKSGSTSPKGLIGHDFEEYLAKNIGGDGSFSVGGRDFDGGIGNRWWEAKSGQYWEMLENNPNKLAKFKSDMGDRLRIATENGATYELFSNTPIPTSIKQWLDKKGIAYTELLD